MTAEDWLREKTREGKKEKREVQPWPTMIPGVKEAIIDSGQERPCCSG